MKLQMHLDCKWFKEKYPEEWKKFGCGPGGTGDYLVPDTMWGLDISEACRIHDWYYRFYTDRSVAGKLLADDLMKYNCSQIIRAGSTCWLTLKLRELRARTYYFMVTRFGQGAWDEVKSVRDK
jgi:hypothetical protein